MFFYILWNFLVGYMVIRVEGVSLEKFINLTVTNGIYLWGINRQNYTTLTAKISINGFRKLHGISRKIRCRIRIVDKRGLPFIIYRYRHRKMLAVGMVLFLMIIYGFSSFIWSVEVQGTESVNPQKLLNELESLGVKPGVFKPNIDTMSIENQLIIDLPEISWASLELRGSRAILRVKESVLPPPIIDKDTPCNIVAAKDGIIDKMIVLDGQAVAKEGQTVRKGQLLVSGIIDHSDTIGVRYVHSMGQIIARTWYEETAELSLKDPYRQRTGRKAVIKYIGWEKLKIPYSKEEAAFDDYDVEILEDGIFITEIYYETEVIYWKNNIQKARKKLEELAEEKAKQAVPRGAKIIDKKVKYDIIEGEKIIAVIYIEALEDIGMQQTIVTQ
ncbi:MAG TPA: sporulation protein YqfD [Clostridiales bacterium]|nr:sporulation protein YqfD [Clostridiales bacterium]